MQSNAQPSDHSVDDVNLHEYFKRNPRDSESIDPDLAFLPLCHTTTEGSFTKIYLGHGLKPQRCKVYDEDLTYFFYGKSSYIVDKKNIANIGYQLPIAILYRFEDVSALGIRRMLPFDSGGFPFYKFEEDISKDPFTILDSSNGEEVKDLIKLIYQDNKSYLRDSVFKANLESTGSNCWAIWQMAEFYSNRFPQEKHVGKQAVSIEIQIKKEITAIPVVIIFPYELLAENDKKRKPFWNVQRIKSKFPNARLVAYGTPVECDLDFESELEFEFDPESDSDLNDGITVVNQLRKVVKKESRDYANLHIHGKHSSGEA